MCMLLFLNNIFSWFLNAFKYFFKQENHVLSFLLVDHCIHTVKKGRCFFLPITHCTSLYFYYSCTSNLNLRVHCCIVPEMFYFPIFVHSLALSVHYALTVHSTCAHRSLIIHSDNNI